MAPSKIELMLEAEKRGILPADKAELLNEARKRGLVPPPLDGGMAALRSEAAKPGAQALGPLDYLTDAGKAIANDLHETSKAASRAAGSETGIMKPILEATGTAFGTAGAVVDAVTPIAPETPMDAAILAGSWLIPQMAVEKLAAPTVVRMAETYTPTFLETFKALKAAGNMEIPLTPAELSGSLGMARLESLLEKLPFSGTMIQRFNEYRHGLITTARNEMLERVGPRLEGEAIGVTTQEIVGGALAKESQQKAAALQAKRATLLKKFGPTKETEQIGDEIIATLLQNRDAMKKAASKLYDAVDEVIPPGRNKVSDINLRSVAKQIQTEDIGRAKMAVGGETNAILQFLSRGPKGGKGYTYQELKTLRSKLGDMIAQENTAAKVGLNAKLGMSTTEGRFYSKLKDALDKDLKAFSDSMGGKVQERMDIANAFYRDYKEVFDNKTIRKMATSKPEVVYDQLIKPGRTSDIKAIKAAVGKQDFDKTFKRRFMDDLVGGGTDDIPDGAAIVKRINSYEPETLRELLTPAERMQLTKFVKTAEMPEFVLSEVKQRVSDLMKKSPTAVYNGVLAGDPTITRAAKEVMGAKRFRVYTRRVLEDIIGSADDGLFTDKQVASALENYGQDALKLHFTDAELTDIRDIGRVRSLTTRTVAQGANPSGTANPIIQMAAGGAVLGAYKSDPTDTTAEKLLKGGAVALSAPILAKFYLSPIGRKLLVDGLNMSAREKGAAVLAGRIAAFVAVAKKEIAEENELERKTLEQQR